MIGEFVTFIRVVYGRTIYMSVPHVSLFTRYRMMKVVE